MTTTITPARLRDMRTLLDAAPVRYSGAAADACDAAANLIEALTKTLEETNRLLCETMETNGYMAAERTHRQLEAETATAELEEQKAVVAAYEGLVDDLMGATGTDNIADAVKAAVAAVEAAQ